MGLREVKSELNKLEKENLIKHISELYKKFKAVKEYFDFYINPKNRRSKISSEESFRKYNGDKWYLANEINLAINNHS